jgi:hypothetical protein
MDKRNTFGICAAALALLAVLAYTQLEIYPQSRPRLPSREVRANEYLALDRWLRETGHPVRIESGGNAEDISSAPEGIVFLRASLLDWQDLSFRRLEPWLAGGRRLILSLDIPWYEEEDEDLSAFLLDLGLRREALSDIPAYTALEDPEPENTGTGAEAGEDAGGVRGDPPPVMPDFDSSVILTLSEEPEAPGGIISMEDPQGIIRLATIPVGEGSVTVTGDPYFMQNLYIDKEENARLSWELTGAGDRENRGIFFVRGRRIVPSLWGNLADRGSLVCLILPALVLLAVGFLMVIPVFGRLQKDEDRPGKPLRERFLAEARFLKKYQGLGLYADIYIRELRSRLRQRGYDEDEIAGLVPPKPGPAYRDFLKFRKALETISERL